AAVHPDERHSIPGVRVVADGQDGPPVTGPGAGRPGGTAECHHVVIVEPQATEGSDRVAGHSEPSTDLAVLEAALQDGAVPAGAAEADRRREPGDAGADHDCQVLHQPAGFLSSATSARLRVERPPFSGSKTPESRPTPRIRDTQVSVISTPSTGES